MNTLSRCGLTVIITIVILLLFTELSNADMTGKVNGVGDVASVFGRTGAITATNGDYTAAKITNTPAGGIAAITAQTALNELDTEKATLASPTFTGTVGAAAITATGTITPTGRLLLPIGQVAYFNTTGTAITLASQSDGATNLVAVAPTTAGTFDTGFDNGGGNTGILRYTGATTKYASIDVAFSGTPATASDVFALGIAKNGTLISGCEIINTFAAAQSATLHCVVSLAQNDTITLLVGNLTAGRNITVNALSVRALML